MQPASSPSACIRLARDCATPWPPRGRIVLLSRTMRRAIRKALGDHLVRGPSGFLWRHGLCGRLAGRLHLSEQLERHASSLGQCLVHRPERVWPELEQWAAIFRVLGHRDEQRGHCQPPDLCRSGLFLHERLDRRSFLLVARSINWSMWAATSRSIACRWTVARNQRSSWTSHKALPIPTSSTSSSTPRRCTGQSGPRHTLPSGRAMLDGIRIARPDLRSGHH